MLGVIVHHRDPQQADDGRRGCHLWRHDAGAGREYGHAGGWGVIQIVAQ